MDYRRVCSFVNKETSNGRWHVLETRHQELHARPAQDALRDLLVVGEEHAVSLGPTIGRAVAVALEPGREHAVVIGLGTRADGEASHATPPNCAGTKSLAIRRAKKRRFAAACCL